MWSFNFYFHVFTEIGSVVVLCVSAVLIVRCITYTEDSKRCFGWQTIAFDP